MHYNDLIEALRHTLDNVGWLTQHAETIKAQFPQEWSVLTRRDASRVISTINALGGDFQTPKEREAVFMFLERVGLFMRDGNRVRVNARWNVLQITHYNVNGVPKYVH